MILQFIFVFLKDDINNSSPFWILSANIKRISFFVLFGDGYLSNKQFGRDLNESNFESFDLMYVMNIT